MTVKQIANRLVELCRKGEYETAYNELYSPEIVSAEPAGAPMQIVKGFEGIKMKGAAWNENIEQMFGSSVGEPIISEDHFAITMSMDYKPKNAPRLNHSEICVYQVQDGKIVREEFFYAPMPAPQNG